MNDGTTLGNFITLEGGEGTGKSTQISLLANFLRKAGCTVVETREPGGSPGSEGIRDLLINGSTERWDPITETMLNYSARREHWKYTILPALKDGSWVSSDRFADSTMAYQGHGLGVDRRWINDLYDIVVGNTMPDLTIIFDMEPKLGLQRANDRQSGGTRYENMDLDFHTRLRFGFLEIAKRNPHRCTVVNGDRSIDVIASDIQQIVRNKFEFWLDG